MTYFGILWLAVSSFGESDVHLNAKRTVLDFSPRVAQKV